MKGCTKKVLSNVIIWEKMIFNQKNSKKTI
jgi:hypothetical protein